ncbi:hypothetical protein E2C01_068976 [Portunus trituberculatus]|uniref:Uncharacterized protein n=1 Tax=Portunus trituberculatus TaxID=210409 RepID=A0A5B7HY63_PORTR|nr:hypothetical protein [Portunus trituberculatus]
MFSPRHLAPPPAASHPPLYHVNYTSSPAIRRPVPALQMLTWWLFIENSGRGSFTVELNLSKSTKCRTPGKS